MDPITFKFDFIKYLLLWEAVFKTIARIKCHQKTSLNKIFLSRTNIIINKSHKIQKRQICSYRKKKSDNRSWTLSEVLTKDGNTRKNLLRWWKGLEQGLRQAGRPRFELNLLCVLSVQLPCNVPALRSRRKDQRTRRIMTKCIDALQNSSVSNLDSVEIIPPTFDQRDLSQQHLIRFNISIQY